VNTIVLKNKKSGERRVIKPDVTWNNRVGSVKEMERMSITEIGIRITIPRTTLE